MEKENSMKIEKVVTTTKTEELEILGATLLSAEEAETLLTEAERVYDNWWWLRSPGDDQNHAAGVRSDGSVDDDGHYVLNGNDCIRPALKIFNLQSSNLDIGDRFKFGGQIFKIISEDLAFCEGDIGRGCFRKDWEEEEANHYETSDVKKAVDNWFEQSITELFGEPEE